MKLKLTCFVTLVVIGLGHTEVQAGKSGEGRGSSGRKSSAPTHVNGHRSNGTYVQPHMRSHADGNVYNNWSTRGNVNPYTGKVGTVNPDRLQRSSTRKQNAPALGRRNPATGSGIQNATDELKVVKSADFAPSPIPEEARAINPPPPAPNEVRAIKVPPPIPDEVRAEYLFDFILDLKANKKLDAAWLRCKELIERFPGTVAAQKARDLRLHIYH